jgi:MscS family membrane protein
MQPRTSFLRVLVIVGAVASVLGGACEPALCQEDPLNAYPLRPPNTASPRDTLLGFKQQMRTAIERWQSGKVATTLEDVLTRAMRYLDLSELPPAVRQDQGSESAVLLLEILSRIELPPPEEIPGVATVEARGLTSWTIPNTEITIARTAEGPDAGEFQFTAGTIAQVPTFYERVEHLPYKPGRLVGVYDDLFHSPGPLLPRAWTTNLPRFAYVTVLNQTVWQWLAALTSLALSGALIAVAYLWGSRVDHAGRGSGAPRYLGRLIATTLAIPLIELTLRFVDDGINLSGTPFLVLQVATGALQAVAVGWLVILVLSALGEAIIRSRALADGNINAPLVRIVMRVLAIIILIYLALYVAESFGIPAAPLIASLGVGGLAIALAVRPTLENIVGGFILFADKPVRVGDFCLFGDKKGTVEEIGLRSTRIRGLDRTVITVPNADFAQHQIINFTRRDQMLMQTTLGLRYETTPDQLRYLLTRLRELFVAHPKVSPEPARARFTGFGDHALNVEVFIYVLSNNYNEFLGIAEDLNLRIIDIVAEAGTGFAFPSQTAYLARDQGLDAARTEAAVAAVEAWRAESALAFPDLDPRRIASLDGTLDFPPRGSASHAEPTLAEPRATPRSRRRRWGTWRSRPADNR